MDGTIKETNLQRILREKNITTAAVGAVCNLNQTQSVVRKLSKTFPFKLPEAIAIHKNLLPEYDFNYLFDEYADIADADDEV